MGCTLVTVEKIHKSFRHIPLVSESYKILDKFFFFFRKIEYRFFLRNYSFPKAFEIKYIYNLIKYRSIKKKQVVSYNFYLVVLPPGVAAFRTPEEPDLAFIGRPELAEPPECKVVLAFGALDLDGGERFYFVLFIIDDGNLVFGPLPFKRHTFG